MKDKYCTFGNVRIACGIPESLAKQIMIDGLCPECFKQFSTGQNRPTVYIDVEMLSSFLDGKGLNNE